MTEETQGTEAGQVLDSNPQPAQPVSPSTEAAQVAAGGEATQQPGQTEGQAQPTVNWQERLSRQQAVLSKQASDAQVIAQAERERSQALQAQLDAKLMEGMTEQGRAEFQGKRERERLEVERQTIEQQRADVEGQGNYWQWFSIYVEDGVPAERIRGCQSFGEMESAARSYWKERALAGSAPAPAAPQPPPVGPADRVQTGGTGAPPSREFDRLRAEGHRPGSKEFRDYVKKMRRSGSKKLL